MDKYQDEINTIILNEQTDFSKKKENISILLDYYNKNLLLNDKLDELNENTLKENNILTNTIDNVISNTNTNERLVYYDYSQVEYLKKMKKYIIYLLIIIYTAFFTRLFIFKRDLITKNLVFSITFLFIMPLFLIPIFTRILLSVYNWIYNDTSNNNKMSSNIILDIYEEIKLFIYSPINFIT